MGINTQITVAVIGLVILAIIGYFYWEHTQTGLIGAVQPTTQQTTTQ